MDKNKLKKEMLEAIFIKTGGRPENPEIAEICAEIAVKNCSIPAVSGQCECDFSIESRQGVDFVRCVNCGDTYFKK